MNKLTNSLLFVHLLIIMNNLSELQLPNFQHPGPLLPDGKSLFPPSVTLFSPDVMPNVEPWGYKPLYKQASSKKWTIWQVMYNPSTGHNYVVSGQLGGKLRIYPKEIKPKGGRNLMDQSISDARGLINKKLDEGRRPFGVEAPTLFYAMLAKTYSPECITQWPASVQPKIDGIRSYSKLDPSAIEGVSMKSRNHKEFPHANHIRKQLNSLLNYLPNGTVIDGEMYIPDATFNHISSVVRREGTIHPDNQKLLYYIFDLWLPENPVWEDRFNILIETYSKFAHSGQPFYALVPIPQMMVFNNDEIFTIRDEYISQGFEGIMIRPFAGKCDGGNHFMMSIPNLNGTVTQRKVCTLDPSTRTPDSIKNSQYFNSANSGSRKVNLMKLKVFLDEEGVVQDIVSGEGTKKGMAILVLKDPRGNVFRLSPDGKDEVRKEWLDNKQNYIGKLYNYEYQNLSEYGVPRFPVGGKGFIDVS